MPRFFHFTAYDWWLKEQDEAITEEHYEYQADFNPNQHTDVTVNLDKVTALVIDAADHDFGYVCLDDGRVFLVYAETVEQIAERGMR